MKLTDASDWIWVGRGPWEKGEQAAVWGEDPGFGWECISTQPHVLL